MREHRLPLRSCRRKHGRVMPRLDPDDPLDAIEPRARTTCLNDVVVDRLLIPLSLLAFWAVLIGSMVEYWGAH